MLTLPLKFETTRLLHEKLKRKDAERSNEEKLILVVRTSKYTSNNSIVDQKSTIKRNKKKDLCNYCKKPKHWA
jgi:hypothetical protein